jgi:hypothetical protein
MYKAMDLFVFNDDSKDWSKDFYKLYTDRAAENKKEEAKADSARVLNTKPSLELKQYAGNYSNEVYGDAQILTRGDSLALILPNNIKVNLSHWNYDTFSGKYERKWYGKDFLQFSLDKEGKVKDFTFTGITYTKKKKGELSMVNGK